MCIVELVQNKYTGSYYYRAIDRHSATLLDDATGYLWFYPFNWEWVAQQLKDRYDAKLTNRWIHRQRAYKLAQHQFKYWE